MHNFINENSAFRNTNTVNVPKIITGLRPYRSAIIPQRIEVKDLPNINADPSRNEMYYKLQNLK